jgi:cytochrome c1
MIRWIARVVGAGFVLAVLWAFGTTLTTNLQSPPTPTAEHEFHRHPKEVEFASDGPSGKFDKQQLQRGFQVYKEVCSGCHSLTRVSFRDLHQLGYEEAEVKAIANQWQVEVPSVNPETGEPATRKAVPSDYFPSPYANETAARAANNNALPPDLSLMAKARHDGPAYIYSLLTGPAAQEVPGRQDAAESSLQPLFRQFEHRHAPAADQRGPGNLRAGQSQADGRPDGEGRRRVPYVDGGAQPAGPPQDRLRGTRLPDCGDDPGLSELPGNLGRSEAQGGAGWPVGSSEQSKADPRQQEGRDRRVIDRHCERSEAIQSSVRSGLLRRFQLLAMTKELP